MARRTRYPNVDVRLSGGYRFPHLDRLVAPLAPLLKLSEPSCVRLDLGGLAFIGPSALALLVASLKRLADEDLLRGGHIVPPRSPQIYNYLQRMDLFHFLPVDKPVESFKRKTAVGFRPCQPIDPEGDYALVAHDLSTALCERCQTDLVTRGAVYISILELAENVVQHAATSAGGIAAAQGWKKRQEVEIGLVDLGLGIRGSLQKNPEYADIEDDQAAIAKAVERRVTSTPERNAGLGLYVMRELLNANGGTFYIRSGRGCVVSSEGLDKASVSELELPGTLVAIRARTDRALNLRNVYRALTSDDSHSEHDPAS